MMMFSRLYKPALFLHRHCHPHPHPRSTIFFLSSLYHQHKAASTMSPKDRVETAIKDNQVAIFSKSWCPHSRKAKELFKEKFPNVKTQIFELDQIEEGEAIQAYLLDKTGQRTVPNVFVAQQHIGGNDDVQAAFKAGKLAPLLGA